MTRSIGSVETGSADAVGAGSSVLIVLMKPVYRAAGRKVNANQMLPPIAPGGDLQARECCGLIAGWATAYAAYPGAGRLTE